VGEGSGVDEVITRGEKFGAWGRSFKKGGGGARKEKKRKEWGGKI